jgi:large subunit ribosomal protein L30
MTSPAAEAQDTQASLGLEPATGTVPVSPRLRITLVKSLIGRPATQGRIARGLGLRKTHSVVEHIDTPIIRGMVRKISHLLTVEVC